jgi:hypothetical protein
VLPVFFQGNAGASHVYDDLGTYTPGDTLARTPRSARKRLSDDAHTLQLVSTQPSEVASLPGERLADDRLVHLCRCLGMATSAAAAWAAPTEHPHFQIFAFLISTAVQVVVMVAVFVTGMPNRPHVQLTGIAGAAWVPPVDRSLRAKLAVGASALQRGRAPGHWPARCQASCCSAT